ncbi:phosphomevalonate kinase [Cimex lectularius]|uniref:Phosphomevalonate kinase n=1 Tax=Cimex lectularius TaxID=79782 RepID=A0A8I6SKE5_CIMLE|nr:phosphomevalonate kinase [Cimex lectularius]XP_024082831.1 phosphomevalonate kinase [Cimex lectularius]
MEESPVCTYLFSGKRKSGKDFLTDRLYEKLNKDKAVVLKISGPIKSHWAKSKNLSYDDLLNSSEYKEQHRKDMIEWSESIRKEDYGYFCSAAVNMYNAKTKPIWIVSDIRRKTDIRWFKENYNVVKTVRVICDEDVRKQRGWEFSEGIDDKESECDLDCYDDWDLIIENNGKTDVDEILNKIVIDMESHLQ